MINAEFEVYRQLERLQTERALLAADPATNRAELAELDAVIVDLREAHTKIVVRRLEREREIERAAKHAEILPKCRAAVDLYHEKNRATEDANRELEIADAALAGAQHRLQAAHGGKPKPNFYPTSKELADWQARVRLAEDELIKAREARGAAMRKRDQLSMESLAAREEFGRLDLQERQLRKPGAQTPPIATAWRIAPIGPELSGVR